MHKNLNVEEIVLVSHWKIEIGSANEYDECVGNARAIEKQSFVSSLDNASTLVTGHIGRAIATSTLCASVIRQTLLLVSDWSISASLVGDESSCEPCAGDL